MSHIDLKKITESIKTEIDKFSLAYDVAKAGTIEYCGDGIARINGLDTVKSGELLEIENGTKAIAFNLEEKMVGAIILDHEASASSGMRVLRTGRIVEVPVGDKLLGRVVDSLGRPIDGFGKIETDKYRPTEAPSAVITDRAKINEPLQTGILAIDSMIPIGRGQRELIIGDRQTGKTAIAIDTIINQKDKNVICVYVSIGQKASTISNIVHILRENNCLSFTCIVSATAKDSAPLQYLAPYCGCAIAEEFMYQGKDVLIVYDDLSKHAVAYRTISLLLKRPPGREAYPGDVFYLHSRLLERAGKLDKRLGGGSMTALPIVETLAGDISAFIPTNVISITDGQIYLEQELFNAGIRPAVNVGLSVSRVGGDAQKRAMRRVSEKLRLDLSQYRELAIFAQFGSDLDTMTQSLLAQGERTTETLKQDQFSPLDLTSQVILLYITTKEFLKSISVRRIREFNEGFLQYLKTHYINIRESIEEAYELSQNVCADLEEAVKEYTTVFLNTQKA